MDDTYVYIKVKLYLKDGQTEESIREIMQEMDSSFDHEEIMSHEVADIHDLQIPKDSQRQLTLFESSEV